MSGVDERALKGAQKAYWMDFGDMDPIEAAIREYLRLTALQSGVSEAGKGWQDISTAPKKGRFLGCDAEGDMHVTWYGKTSHVPIYGWCWTEHDPEDTNLWGPTHWMPLPVQPSARSDAGEAGE